MQTIIVLAMHGAPPNDFPHHEMAELLGLHARLEHAAEAERAALERRHAELDAKMREWPRTAQNDLFYIGSQELTAHLSRAMGREVILGFNEFCAPSLDDALDQAVAQEAEQVIVITPMMTRGGEHAEADIPAAIQRARERHPKTPIVYAWPFETSKVAQFLAAQVARLPLDHDSRIEGAACPNPSSF
jgi:sirohydrochlorin cobaltochelatase